MRFIDLVETADRVAATRSRRDKVALLADCLRLAPAPLVGTACACLSGILRQGRLGIGPRVLDTVEAPAALQASLSLAEFSSQLEHLAALSGAGVQRRRREALVDLLGRMTAPEQSFIRRLLLGELRQGALDGVMSDAIARAAGLDTGAVRRAAMYAGELPLVADAALRGGAAALARFSLTLFTPLQPMLAQPAEDMAAAFAGDGPMICEHKLDGARVQLHREGDAVRVFSRQMNDVTARVPELVAAALALRCDSIVLDGEAIAFGADGRPRPFQVTMQRFGRQRGAADLVAQLPLSVRYFDCLHLDGVDLTGHDTRARQAELDRVVPVAQRVARIETADVDEARRFFDAALAQGHEGVMAKSPAALYRAGSRGADWYKVKTAHTLDLVVLAAEWGSGRRRGRLSNLHLGARDAANGGFVMLGKTFKGLSDATLAWQTEALLAIADPRAGADDNGVVRVRPELVVEIAFSALQASRQYPAGLALRFARVRRYRPDKRAADADTLDSVRRLYEAQPG
jgi:DNA ligase-1